MINRDEEEHDEENETHRQMYQLFSPILFSTTLLSIEYICAHRLRGKNRPIQCKNTYIHKKAEHTPTLWLYIPRW